jgi:hypothetical protein
LGEPSELFDLVARSRTPAEYAAGCQQFLEANRNALVGGHTVRDRRREDGTPVTNYVAAGAPGAKRALNVEEHDVSRPLTGNGLVAVKHNAPFLAVLPELERTGVPVWAIVRHPVPVVASWLSVDLPVSKGALPVARRFWPECEGSLEGLTGLERLARLYDNLCRRLAESGAEITRYEDLVARPDIVEQVTGRRFARPPEFVDRSSQSSAAPEAGSDVARVTELVGEWARRFYPDL